MNAARNLNSRRLIITMENLSGVTWFPLGELSEERRYTLSSLADEDRLVLCMCHWTGMGRRPMPAACDRKSRDPGSYMLCEDDEVPVDERGEHTMSLGEARASEDWRLMILKTAEGRLYDFCGWPDGTEAGCAWFVPHAPKDADPVAWCEKNATLVCVSDDENVRDVEGHKFKNEIDDGRKRIDAACESAAFQ